MTSSERRRARAQTGASVEPRGDQPVAFGVVDPTEKYRAVSDTFNPLSVVAAQEPERAGAVDR